MHDSRRAPIVYFALIPAGLFLALLFFNLRRELRVLAPPAKAVPGPPGAAAAAAAGEEDDPEERAEEAVDALQPARDSSAPRAATATRPLCFVYDRPPRTGSTTISATVRPCLQALGFQQPRAESRSVRPLLVRRMLALDGPRVGLLSKHMYMSVADTRRLRAECERLFYVSSTREMRARMWSAVKDGVSGEDDAVNDRLEKKALKRYFANENAEGFLEEYPYLGVNNTRMGVPVEQRMVPDYVIRNELMDQDLGRLMTVFNCSTSVHSKNVHKGKEALERELLKKSLEFGDATYRRLSKLAADVNEEGLRKAAAFLQ